MNTDTLTATPSAIAHIKKMLTKRGSGIGMRLAVKDTGCSGKSYVVSLVDSTDEKDHVYSIEDNLIVCVDPYSYVFVSGTTIDYVRQGLNGKFMFHNPHEKNSCGCGESFNV